MSSSRSIGDQLVKAGGLILLAHILFKIAGIVLNLFMGYTFEAEAFEPIFVVAFTNVIFLIFIIGEELIGPAFLPVFMEEKEKNGEASAWSLAKTFLCIQSLILGCVAGLLWCFPEEAIRLTTEWDTDFKAEHFALASSSVKTMAVALFGLSLASTTYMLLNAYKKFFLAAFADASFKYVLLIVVAAGVYLFGASAKVICLAVILGSVGKLLTHAIGLWAKRDQWGAPISLKHPALKKMLWLMLPLLVGIVFAKFRDVYNESKAFSAYDVDGLMKASFFGKKLYQTLTQLIPYTISIAMFPFFCELSAKGDKQKLGKLLTQAGRMLLAVFIPFAIVFFVMSPEAVTMLEGGKFSAEEVNWMGVSMACYVLALPAYGLEPFVMQAYFAERRMWSVIIVGAIFSAMSALISFLGVNVFGATPTQALVWVALGYSFSRTCKTWCLVVYLRRFMPVFPAGETLGFCVKLTVMGLVLGGAVAMAYNGVELVWENPGRMATLLVQATVGMMAVGLFVVLSKVMGIREPFEMVRWAREKTRRKKG